MKQLIEIYTTKKILRQKICNYFCDVLEVKNNQDKQITSNVKKIPSRDMLFFMILKTIQKAILNTDCVSLNSLHKLWAHDSAWKRSHKQQNGNDLYRQNSKKLRLLVSGNKEIRIQHVFRIPFKKLALRWWLRK